MPTDLQDALIARYSDPVAVLADELRAKIRRELSGYSFNADDLAKRGSQFLPQVDHLAALPRSQRAVVEVVLTMGEYTCPGDLDRKHASGFGDHKGPYHLVDIALYRALLDLWATDEKPSMTELSTWANDITRSQKKRAEYGIEGYMAESLKLLRQMWRAKVIEAKVSRAIGDHLPLEVISMVEKRYKVRMDCPAWPSSGHT